MYFYTIVDFIIIIIIVNKLRLEVSVSISQGWKCFVETFSVLAIEHKRITCILQSTMLHA